MSREPNPVTAVLNSKRIWLVHIVANALLFTAFFHWLRISDESAAWFTLSVVAALALTFLLLLLHSATFAYFRMGTESSFVSALRRVMPRLLAFLLWTLIFAGVLWFLGQLWDYTAQAGGWTHHVLPGFARRNVSPRSTITLVSALLWFLFYFVWPILFLPVGVQTATAGLRGLFAKRAWRSIREVRFWVTYAVCFLCSAYIPYKLAWMIPTKASPLLAQEWSMAVRLGIGYLLLVTGWLVLCAEMARVTDDSAPKLTDAAAPLMSD